MSVMSKSSVVARVLGGDRLECQVVSPRAERLTLTGTTTDVEPEVERPRRPFADFDPRLHYKLTLADSELTEVERNARAATSVDDIDLDLDQ